MEKLMQQMAWLSTNDGTKILHLKDGNKKWKPYNQFPGIAVPDYKVPGESKGWATYQKLHKSGWELIATSDVEDKIAS